MYKEACDDYPARKTVISVIRVLMLRSSSEMEVHLKAFSVTVTTIMESLDRGIPLALSVSQCASESLRYTTTR